MVRKDKALQRTNLGRTRCRVPSREKIGGGPFLFYGLQAHGVTWSILRITGDMVSPSGKGVWVMYIIADFSISWELWERLRLQCDGYGFMLSYSSDAI